MTEVQQQKPIAEIRSYLKLYTTLPLPKLAALMEKSEDDVRSKLMCFKHKLKSCQAVAAERDPLATDVDFYVDGDMIHIADTKVTRHYGDFFVRHIHKYQEVNVATS
jgi:translation initiation factor 3 subunit L